MCLSPIHLLVKRDYESNPVLARRVVRYRAGLEHSEIDPRLKELAEFKSVEEIEVPCNKCPECLAMKQQEMAVRSYIEAKKKGSMHLVTLTYDDSHLPFTLSTLKADKDTGEMFMDSSHQFIDGPIHDFIGKSRQDLVRWFKGMPKLSTPAYLMIEETETDPYLFHEICGQYDPNYFYLYVVTPSIRRRDPRLWLKRCRVNYQRKFGETLPDFSYILVGEYGSKSCRPHYHLCFFGLTTRQVKWLASQWQYGFSYVQEVNATNKDGSNGYIKAALYVGKYISKGFFDCSSVLRKQAEKPRYCASKNFGIPEDIAGFLRNGDLTKDSKRMDYLRGQDIINYDDIDFPINTYKDYDQFKRFTEEIEQRFYFTINGYRFRLPFPVIRRCFYIRQKENGKVHYLASHLRNTCMAFKRSMHIEVPDSMARQETENVKTWSQNIGYAGQSKYSPSPQSARAKLAVSNFQAKYRNDRY